MFPRTLKRRNKKSEITFIAPVYVPKKTSAGMVHHDGVNRAADTELIQPRLYLGREAEEGGRTAFVPNQDSQLIQDFFPAKTPEQRALIRPGNNLGDVVIKKFGQLGNPMANDIMKQIARQP